MVDRKIITRLATVIPLPHPIYIVTTWCMLGPLPIAQPLPQIRVPQYIVSVGGGQQPTRWEDISALPYKSCSTPLGLEPTTRC